MQNRPAPNPVVYVQQLPNNMIQPVQPQMDQNQLYLQQNFANFQLQQHMLAQNHQEIRPGMQLANIVPNMVQNVQQSIQANERNINQNPNTGQMQQNAQNMIQSQMTVARQVPNQGNQTVEVQRQMFMNVRPQMGQQMNISRPVMSLNQLQNMQAMANMQNLQIQQANAGQTFVQNIGQRLPQNVNTVRPQIMPSNVMNIQNVNSKPPPSQDANKAMNSAAGSPVPSVRNFAQNYNCRPIQPRRRFVDNNANVPKMQPQNVPVQQSQNVLAQQQQNVPAQQQQNIPAQQQQNIPAQQQQNVPAQQPQQPQQPQHTPVQTPPTQQPHQYNQEKANSHQIVTNMATNTAPLTLQSYLNNPNVSRKRKSESPDEIQNKMAAPPTTQPIYKNQQGIVITKLCNEIGTNTSPVHKPSLKVPNTSHQAFQINANTPMVIVENAEQNKQDVNQIKNVTETRTVMTPAPSESDKLIRNTVYTQARGRLLQDKISDNIPQQAVETKAPESVQNTTEIKTNIEAQTDNDTEMTEVPTDKVITVTVQSEMGASVPKAPANTIESRIMQILENMPKRKFNPTDNEHAGVKNIKTPEKKPVDDKNIETPEIKAAVIKTEEDSNKIKVENVKTNESDVSKTITEAQDVKMEVKEQTSEVKDEKVEVTEKIVTKQDILTHVVDGYVIQESNFAFPVSTTYF